MTTSDGGAFTGKVALVTGGTQGLGEAIALTLVERGLSGLVICGRDAERGARVAARARAAGADACFVAADLARVEDARALVAAADRAFGRLDILVNAAGDSGRGTIDNTSPELFDRLFAINIRAPFFLAQSALPIMRRGGRGGAIVNVISMSGHGGQSFLAAYSASKGALITLTRNLGFSVMREGIRVNGLCLGFTLTPGADALLRESHGPDWRSAAEAAQPSGRLIQPEDVARTVAFLASGESGLMSGAIIDYAQHVRGCFDAPAPPPVPMGA